MAANHADFTLTFRAHAAGRRQRSAGGDARVRELFDEPEAWDEWAQRWRQRLAEEPQTPQEHAALSGRPTPPSSRATTGSRRRWPLPSSTMTTDRSRSCSSCCRGRRGPAGFYRLRRAAGPRAARLSHLLRHRTSPPRASKRSKSGHMSPARRWLVRARSICTAGILGDHARECPQATALRRESGLRRHVHLSLAAGGGDARPPRVRLDPARQRARLHHGGHRRGLHRRRRAHRHAAHRAPGRRTSRRSSRRSWIGARGACRFPTSTRRTKLAPPWTR